MVDNVDITPGSGATVAADEIGGVKYQRVKATWGPDGTANDTDVATGKPMPMQVRSATGLVPIGEPTDAKSTATDTTSVSLISIAKQISASAQALAALITSGSLSVFVDADSVNANGQATMANSAPVVIASNQSAVPVSNTPLTNMGAGEYETVAASQTAQVLGPTGGTGDFIAGVLVIPATTSPGNVLLLDNATSITIFTGGGTSVSNLVPFYIPLNMISVSGAWKLTTGSNVSCIGIGNFT